MSHFIHDIMRYANGMNQREWLFVLLAVVVIGAICLRGFGSRTGY